MSYIRIEKVCKSFGDNQVLKSIDMEIEKGSLVTLLGPSGCGKSTLLRCMAGLESVSEGKIYLDGEDITDLSPSQRNIGMVFQQYSLFPNMNVFQNIAFGLKMQKLEKAQIEEKVRHAISLVELDGKENEYPVNLSGGQQQRVALARSIVMEPKVLLLDEPLSAIDAKLRKSLQQRIREIHEQLDLTVVFVTHDQDEAMVMSDVIQLFYEGRIEQSGSPVSMYTQPRTKFAASFIGNYNIINTQSFIEMLDQEQLEHTIRPGDHQIAIRPETVQILKESQETSSSYILAGEIVSNRPRGNVLRYKVDVKGTSIYADVLFRSFTLFENGERVFLEIPKHDCLELTC